MNAQQIKDKTIEIFKSKKMALLKILAGAVIGGLLGFAYYKLIGCKSGTCPIRANPWSSIIFGAIFGALMAN